MARAPVSIERTAVTLFVGAGGGLAFVALGMPLAWLSGSAAAVAAVSLAGKKLGIHLMLREAAIVTLGLMLGSTVTPETIALLPRWPLTLAGLACAMLTIMASGAFYLERVHGLDRATARLASMPGALNFVMLLAMETNSDPRRVAIIQVVRLSAILLLLPSIVTLLGEPAPAVPFQGLHAAVKPIELVLLFACGIACAYGFHRLGTPAPSLFGAMLGGALLFGPGLLDTAMPLWLTIAAFVVLGSMIGANFVGADMRMFLEMLVAGLGSLAVAGLVALAWAAPLAWLVGLPATQVWLAYAPGGVETTAILALSLGLDAAFVSGHHIARVVILNITVGFWIAPFLLKNQEKPASGPTRDG
jgi:membrane AbrB-like protein